MKAVLPSTVKVCCLPTPDIPAEAGRLRRPVLAGIAGLAGFVFSCLF